MCEMVEYASIRFRLVCTMAVRLPIASDSTDSTTSIICQSLASGSRPSTSTRMNSAKAATFGPAAISSVTAVGEP
ncbi:hypothetical protein D3C87_1117200 [compost metagenome]